MTGLTQAQADFLLLPVDPRRVQTAQGQAHMAAWDIRRTLLRAFGWGGWGYNLADVTLIHERESQAGRWTVVYRVTLTLVIRDRDGEEVARFTEAATGDAQNQKSPGDAHDMALKTAESQALKRAAMNLGDQFGLSLYNAGSRTATVVRSLPHLPQDQEPAALPEAEQVTAGEDDAHAKPQPVAPPVAAQGDDTVPEPPAPTVLSDEAAEQWTEAIGQAGTVAEVRSLWRDVEKGGQLDVALPEDYGGDTLRALLTHQAGQVK